MQTMTPMAMMALVGLGSMVLAAAQAPVPADVDDASRYGAPVRSSTPAAVRVSLDIDEASGRCSPARLELPSGHDVDLQLENRTWREISFAAPDFFTENQVVEREGGSVVETESGVLHVSVPPAGMTSIRLRTGESGAFEYRCVSGGSLERASLGEIVVARAGS